MAKKQPSRRQAGQGDRIVGLDEARHRQRLADLERLRPLIPPCVPSSFILNEKLAPVLKRLAAAADDPSRIDSLWVQRGLSAELWAQYSTADRFEVLFVQPFDDAEQPLSGLWLLDEDGRRIIEIQKGVSAPSEKVVVDLSTTFNVNRVDSEVGAVIKEIRSCAADRKKEIADYQAKHGERLRRRGFPLRGLLPNPPQPRGAPPKSKPTKKTILEYMQTPGASWEKAEKHFGISRRTLSRLARS